MMNESKNQSTRHEVTPQTEISEGPSFTDLLRDGDSTQLGIEAVSDFLSSPGISGSPLEEEIRQAIAPDADRIEPAEGLFGDLGRALKEIFSSRRESVVDSEDVNIPLGVYWLDVPKVSSASVDFTVSTETSETITATVKVAGIGGGPASTVTVKGSVGYTTSETAVLSVQVPATVQRVEIRRGNNVEEVIHRLTDFKWNKRVWTPEPMSVPLHGVGDPVETPTYDNRQGQGTFSQELSVETGTSWDYSIGLNVPRFSLDISIDSKGSYSKSVDYAYKLPKGHLYVASRFTSPPCFIWAVDP